MVSDVEQTKILAVEGNPASRTAIARILGAASYKTLA